MDGLDLLLEYLQQAVHQLKNEWNIVPRLQDDVDIFKIRVERLFRCVSVIDFTHHGRPGIEDILSAFSELMRKLEDIPDDFNNSFTPVYLDYSGRRGRPKVIITEKQLYFYLKNGFTIPAISTMLGTSQSTVKRRMRDNYLKKSYYYSTLSDEELDENILHHLSEFPNTGYKRMKGFLLASGIRVQELRIREAMRRVDPEGVVLRALQSRPVLRRKYSVPGPLSLWHMDGNHKLIW